MKLNKIVFLWLSLSGIALQNCQSEGKTIYLQVCGNCHMENGLGFKRLIPPLDPEAFVQRRSQLVCTVLTGVNDSISGSFMPAYAHLSDIQISNVLNFIRHTAALPGKAFTDAEVSEGRSLCE